MIEPTVLYAEISFDQEVNPASFGTIEGNIGYAIEGALEDLVIEHPHGRAVLHGVAVKLRDAP